MGNTIKRDGNYGIGGVRVGDPISFFLEIAQADITVNRWYRLCPSGNAGNRVSETELDLGTLPSWLDGVDFTDWRIKILNPGYNDGGDASELIVESISDSGRAKLRDRLSVTLPANGVHWVLFPEILFELSIILNHTSTDLMDIGIGHSDILNPDVRKISIVQHGTYGDYTTSKTFRTTRVDRFFFRYRAVSGDQNIEWGETVHYR